MTHDEIMALQGEALNIAVATQVMGLRVADDGRPMLLPDYQGDLNLAWAAAQRAVDEVGSDIPVVARTGGLNFAGKPFRPRCEIGGVWGYGTTLSEALCRAALLAVTHVRHGKNGGEGR